jgi:hypothetical protein
MKLAQHEIDQEVVGPIELILMGGHDFWPNQSNDDVALTGARRE